MDLFKRIRNQITLALLVSVSTAWAGGWLGSAGKVEITPDLSRPVYLAGFGSKGRIPTGIHDPLWARGFAISDGKQTAVLITLDLIGFPRPYVQKIRQAVNTKAYILIASNHTHSGPDTLGLWGPKAGKSGVDEVYMQSLVDKISTLARELLKNLEPVEISAAAIRVPVKGIVKDIRDPVVIDNELSLLRLRSLKTRKPLGTLINWACHPETLGKKNTQATRDFSGYLVDETEKLLGGTAGHFAGAIGGLMTPDAEDSFEEAERVGKSLAGYASDAAKRAQVIPPAPLIIREASALIPIENNLYLAFLANVKHGRPLYNKNGNPWKSPYWDKWPALSRPFLSWFDTKVFQGGRPYMETEVAVIRAGDLGFLAIPGELFPELAIGGYKGEFSFHHPLISPKNPNPPDFTHAPQGPYLKERLKTPYRFLLGLSNDELGYIVPAYDFKINRWSPVLSPRPKGTHYEETNSVGIQAESVILGALEPLFR